MTSRRKTIKTGRSEARLYLTKAKEFCQEATAAVASSRNDAAILNAVHAAISAADAVCVVLGGRRSADPDHHRAADLLKEIGGTSSDIATHVRQLRELLAKTNAVEYESRLADAKEATGAVQRAERFVAWASDVVEAARL